MKPKRSCRTLARLLGASIATTITLTVSASAGEVVKANNADPLSSTSSWALGALPTAADVALWDLTVAAANNPAEIEVYPAQHGWCAIDSQVFDQVQADRAWERLLAWGSRDPQATETQATLRTLWGVSQPAVSQTLQQLIAASAVEALPRKGRDPIQYMLTGTARLAF